ncbi:mechanosensitive ion channel family protein [Rhizobium arsenicireducens]
MTTSTDRVRRASRVVWPIIVIIPALAIQGVHVSSHQSVQPEWTEKASICVILFAGAILFSRLLSIFFDRRLTKNRRPKLLRELTGSLAFLAAAIGSASVLFGDFANGILAGSGLIIAIIGFAMRNVVADILTGIAFGLEAPFRIGDWVDFGGTTKGQIVEIGWRSTRLLTRDATYMILPNSQVARQQLTNYSAPRRHYRTQVTIMLEHDVEVSSAKAILLRGALAAGTIGSDPPPDVRLVALSLDGAAYVVRFWVPNFAEDMDCRDRVLVSIASALSEAAIRLPGQCAETRRSRTTRNSPLEQGNEPEFKNAA